MSKIISCIVAVAFAGMSVGAAACPDAKSKDKTASGEQNMSKPSEKLSKTQKSPKSVSAEGSGNVEKLLKPKV